MRNHAFLYISTNDVVVLFIITSMTAKTSALASSKMSNAVTSVARIFSRHAPDTLT